MIIHDDQAMDSGATDRVEDSVQAILNGAGINARKVLNESIPTSIQTFSRVLTGERFFNASPTRRLRSSYTPPLIKVMTSTASKTL